MKKRVSRGYWVIYESDGKGKIGRCMRCNLTLTLQLPILLEAAVLYMKAFVVEHSQCKEPPK